MGISFRVKLMASVGAGALALVLLMLAGTLINRRVSHQLTTIQERYIPRIEAGPKLEADFERLKRSFQDAVAANDMELLEGSSSIKDHLVYDLAQAESALQAREVTALRTSLDEYYEAAYTISKRLIDGETGMDIVESMREMQQRQARAVEALTVVTTFNRGELTAAFREATSAAEMSSRLRLLLSAAYLALVLALALWLNRTVLRSLGAVSFGLQRFGRGQFDEAIPVDTKDEFGDVAEMANQMAQSLKRLDRERERNDWIKGGHAGLVEKLRGEMDPEEAATHAVTFLTGYLGASAGALYYLRDDELRLLGRSCLKRPEPTMQPESFQLGEGVLGQAALREEITVLTEPPEESLRIRSGVGDVPTRCLVLLPLLHVGVVVGVLEVALVRPWSDDIRELLLSVRETMTIAIEVARARKATTTLLAETQNQARRLEEQEEELRATNDGLQAQQEELQRSNEELAQQAEELEVQRRQLQEKNEELESARLHLEEKTAELVTTSAYKSQFLANMSHELRTPLNSMLLLSHLLSSNDSKNLTKEQVEYAQTIHTAGEALLALINQVLDLSKIEAGKETIKREEVTLEDILERCRRVFAPLAREKKLDFDVALDADLPKTIRTDAMRAEQILTNLVGNAIKFTERGSVRVHITKPNPSTTFYSESLEADRAVAFTVSDTGPGITREFQERIFAPFEQGDGDTDRRYGGTGLGLSISRELAQLLGGELLLESTLGEGSLFTCYLPFEAPQEPADGESPRGSTATPQKAHVVRSPVSRATSAEIKTQTRVLENEDRATLLVIEDDPRFADVFRDIIGRQGLEFVLAETGAAGLALAKKHKLQGIILDVQLPDMDGFEVMEALRADPSTQEVPVHFVSSMDAAEHGLGMGAIGYLTKPASPKELVQVIDALVPTRTKQACRILVAEDDVLLGDSVLQKLASAGFEARHVTTAQAALHAIKKSNYSCLVLDLSLPDMDGLEVLEHLENVCEGAVPAVVVYTARALSKHEAVRLERYAEAVVLKDGPSSDRLVHEVCLFARRLAHQPGTVPKDVVPESAAINLRGKTVLVADDDMRTVYALSAVLQAKSAKVLVAETGAEALKLLEKESHVDVVFMDIMMPEMDGYEAMRRLRASTRFSSLPIIALTAKGMPGEREKCMEAGASDYMSKPVDVPRLMEILQSHVTKKESPVEVT